MSPLLDDSVKEGVPSVQVGVEPSTEAGGVQVRVRPVAVAPEPKPDVEELDSTLREDLLSGRDSNLMSDMLQHHVFTTVGTQNNFKYLNQYVHYCCTIYKVF